MVRSPMFGRLLSDCMDTQDRVLEHFEDIPILTSHVKVRYNCVSTRF